MTRVHLQIDVRRETVGNNQEDSGVRLSDLVQRILFSKDHCDMSRAAQCQISLAALALLPLVAREGWEASRGEPAANPTSRSVDDKSHLLCKDAAEILFSRTHAELHTPCSHLLMEFLQFGDVEAE